MLGKAGLTSGHYCIASELVPVCPEAIIPWPHFYQTRSAWSVDQGSNKNHSPAYNFAPTVIKFCVMWEGLSLPHDTKFGNCRCKIVDSRSFPNWSLIHGLRWSGLKKVGPELPSYTMDQAIQFTASIRHVQYRVRDLNYLLTVAPFTNMV